METVKTVLSSTAMETLLTSIYLTLHLLSTDESLYSIERAKLQNMAREIEGFKTHVYHRRNIALGELKNLQAKESSNG